MLCLRFALTGSVTRYMKTCSLPYQSKQSIEDCLSRKAQKQWPKTTLTSVTNISNLYYSKHRIRNNLRTKHTCNSGSYVQETVFNQENVCAGDLDLEWRSRLSKTICATLPEWRKQWRQWSWYQDNSNILVTSLCTLWPWGLLKVTEISLMFERTFHKMTSLW